MNEKNTLNICLGHLPFPIEYSNYIDLMISPKFIQGSKKLAIINDNLFGKNGSSLSEYVQLLWLLEHLDEITVDYKYLRVFHYRRFVSQKKSAAGKPSSNLPWSSTISKNDLILFNEDFNRFSNGETFNTPVQFNGGMLGQYATAHLLNDILNFSNYLVEEKIFSPTDASDFIRENINIPACNIGIFKIETYREIFTTLKKAANFLHSMHFVARQGYQRRTMGFLLERLNGFLILRMIRQGLTQATFGRNMVISEDAIVSITNEI